MQSPTTPLHSNALTSASTPPLKPTAMQPAPAAAGAGGVPTTAQTVRNAVIGTVASETTKAAVGPVLGAVAQGASVVGQLSTPIGIVGLALGAGGLVLGAYSVYSVHRLRGTVAELQGEVARGSVDLRKAVERGCQQLTDCVNDMSTKLTSGVACAKDEIVEAVREGFQGLHIRLDVMEERELGERMEALVEQYSLCFSVMALGKVNKDSDCKRLEDDAIAALVKIKSALKTMSKGTAERLPLVALYTFATRARVDARDMRAPGDASPEDPFRERLLTQAMALVKEEVVAMLESHSLTLYTVGVCLARTLAQYRLLHRGLALALQGPAAEQPLEVRVDGALVPTAGSEDIVWDDGLDLVREVFMEEPGREAVSEAIEMATLADLLWYAEWKQLGIGTLLAQFPPQVMAGQVLAELGVPVISQRRLGQGSLEKLKALVLPSFRRHAEERLTKVLDFADVEVNLAGRKTAMQWTAISPQLQLTGHTGTVRALVHASDGTLFSGSYDHTVKVWKGGRCIATLRRHLSPVNALAYASDGTLFSSSDDRSIKQWKDGQCIATMSTAHTDEIWALALAPDGTLFSGSKDSTIKQWKGTRCIAVLNEHSFSVTVLTFAPDGTLFSGSGDKTIKQWRNRECIATLRGHKGAVQAVTFAPDGTLYSGSDDRTIKQWRDGECIATLTGHTGYVWTLAFAPDGTLFLGSGDKTIKQWRGGECIGTLEGHTNAVFALSFASDGTLFSGSKDKSIKQWKVGEVGCGSR